MDDILAYILAYDLSQVFRHLRTCCGLCRCHMPGLLVVRPHVSRVLSIINVSPTMTTNYHAWIVSVYQRKVNSHLCVTPLPSVSNATFRHYRKPYRISNGDTHDLSVAGQI